jgi:hypothetical protein
LRPTLPPDELRRLRSSTSRPFAWTC